LFQGEADVVQDLCPVEVLFKVLYFKYAHTSAPLSEEFKLFLQPAEQEGDDAVEHEVVHARKEQRPEQAGVAVRALEEGKSCPDDLLIGDYARERGVLDQRDYLVGHGRDDALYHLQKRDLE